MFIAWNNFIIRDNKKVRDLRLIFSVVGITCSLRAEIRNVHTESWWEFGMVVLNLM